MGMHEARGTLTKAFKELLLRWAETRAQWDDVQAEQFEQTYLRNLESDLEVAAKAQARIEQINAQFQTESSQLEANDAGKRQVVLEEYDRATSDVNAKMQQATWLAESVFEGAQNGIRADSKKAKELLATQI